MRLRTVLLPSLVGLSMAVAACAPAPAPGVGPTSPTTRPARTGVTHPITFPVSPGASYIDSFGAPRSGGRSHEGQDLMAKKGSPVVATVSGTLTFVRHDTTGRSGNLLRLEGDDGWTYWYIHLNNDSPGTDDGANRRNQAFAPGIEVDARVRAGQHLGYVGDSGNAENSGSHLHFEMYDADGVLVNAYPSLRAATPAPRITSPIGTWTSS